MVIQVGNRCWPTVCDHGDHGCHDQLRDIPIIHGCLHDCFRRRFGCGVCLRGRESNGSTKGGSVTPAQRTGTAAGLAILIAAPAEGIRQYAYYDPPGILTVCKGHTGPDVQKGRKYSLAECDVFMTEDMKKAVLIVDRCQPGLPVEILASFADATFNMGPTIACNTKQSTAARMLASKDYAGACNQLPRWDKAKVLGVMITLPGLTSRREKERQLCLTGVN